MSLIPVILCGGAGSRLWPVSRESHPKPFIRLADGESLLQKAFMRAIPLVGVEQLVTVTNRDFLFKIEDELRDIEFDGVETSFILEPFGRNTAAAVAAATLSLANEHPEAKVLILAADHLIADQEKFSSAVQSAVLLAEMDQLVTFGICPTSPETGFGYIEAEGSRVKRFVEKPDVGTATEFLASGRFYWNSGMFCFKVGVMLKEMELHCPEILGAVRKCLMHSRCLRGEGGGQTQLDPELFAKVPLDSIDYAVLEKSTRVAVVPCDIGWSDIGSWSALAELVSPDGEGNRVEGGVLLHNVSNCSIRSDTRFVGAVGVNDLVIVDTQDALLVANKACVQDVRHVYDGLKRLGHEAYKLHRTVHRPWGTYTVLDAGERYKIKRIEVRPGGSLSLQMHHHRSEHWVVLSGMAKVVNGEREICVGANESTYIQAGHLHRLSNPGVIPLVMIEVQTGEYLGEDDIVRFQDDYGR